MIDKSDLLRRAAMLLKLSKAVADPGLAASLVRRAADLQAQADATAGGKPSENKPVSKPTLTANQR